MNDVHLYAIIPSGEKMTFPVTGMNGDHDEVQTIPHGEIAAVVSASPVMDYQGLTREQVIHYLLTHQRVIETVMHNFPVLPVKFGTTLGRDTGIPRLLAQGEALFRRTLNQFAGQQQFEVVALWKTEEVLQEISQDEAIRHFKDELRARGTEISLSERVALGQMVHAAMVQRRNDLRDRILAVMREVAVDTISNALLDDGMVVNLAILINQSDYGVLNERLQALDEEFAGRLNFRCVGPLPPHSFACVQVWEPTFETIDPARRLLGLDETAFPGDIKRAYRQLARQWHPDINPDDPEAEAHMTALTNAYNLLTLYADNQMATPDDSQPTPCRFDRAMVECALVIAIQRQ